ncbi:MAG: ankyrin repeat domain-containing protein [Verrucomicrobia bacterium]|nr:ankyrin repeat domain-containing protein [Verrucomicrobiota bacterium]
MDATDRDKATPLVHASAGGHLALVRLLLERGAQANHKCLGGNTALSFAAYNGHEEVVRELLEAGAQVNATIMTPAGNVPVLVYAAAKGYRGVVELFLKHGATLNPKKAEVLPLQMTAETTNMEMVSYLLSAGADVNARQDLCGYTSLIKAASKSTVEMVRLLIEAGADVDARDKIGMTALMIAARRGDQEIVKELLASGADARIAYEDPNGKRTALDMARECDRSKVARLLEKWQEVTPRQTPVAARASVVVAQPGAGRGRRTGV